MVINNLRKSVLAAISLSAILFSISGCSSIHQEPVKVEENDVVILTPEERKFAEANAIAETYYDIYEEAAAANTLGTLEVTRSMINRLGENGYVAVDDKNQIDMTEADQVMQFCEKVDTGEEAELTIIVLSYLGGFTKYDLQTEEGEIDIVRGYYQYVKGKLENGSMGSYRASTWQYTEEGYLVFEGNWFSEEYYMLAVSEVPECVMLRVQPLDEKCRELNRQYLLPIGYGLNNMFLVDWSEDDFGELNFYDLYDIFYPIMYGQSVPYEADEDLEVGAVYQIPKEEFESIIMQYFKIDSETLQSKTTYWKENAAYEYKPRGFYEIEYPIVPYPEIVGYADNADGTITLTVNVIDPDMCIAKVYTHEVVVRPLEDGGVQYVSNRIIPSQENHEVTWHMERLTAEQWEEVYGNGKAASGIGSEKESAGAAEGDVSESSLWFLPQAGYCLITEKEEKNLQDMALSAAYQVKEVYQNAEIAEDSFYDGNVKDFTNDQLKKVVKLLGKADFVSVADDINMENYERVREFYSAYLEKQDAMVTILEVRSDGTIGATTFIYRDKLLQTYYVGIGWKEGGTPEIKETLISDIAELKLTEKGYFIYAYENINIYGNLRQYWRIKPLSDKCRELTEKYISGLSYVNYNMLVTDWGSSNVEDILMPCMFEDMYRIYTGENLSVENDKIPAELYEKVMTTYFPVSKEQLRQHCGYDEKSNSYPYERIEASQYPPFGEVVDYTENGDGTITLMVDGVWPDYNSDCAFTNQIVIQPFKDGTFKYLSNSIEEKELELPPIAIEH